MAVPLTKPARRPTKASVTTPETMPMNLADSIRAIPDYPRPGIIFRDITTLLGDARAFRRAVDELVQPFAGLKIAKIAGIEARGFILGGAVAHQLSAGFIPVRKKGKLPQETLQRDLFARIRHGRDRDPSRRGRSRASACCWSTISIATGGTAEAAVNLLAGLGAEVGGSVLHRRPPRARRGRQDPQARRARADARLLRRSLSAHEDQRPGIIERSGSRRMAGASCVIDQTRLPFRFETVALGSAEQAADAIRSMVVRGAPLIGATAAYGVALAMRGGCLRRCAGSGAGAAGRDAPDRGQPALGPGTHAAQCWRPAFRTPGGNRLCRGGGDLRRGCRALPRHRRARACR